MRSLEHVEAPLYRKDVQSAQALACVMVSYHTGPLLFDSIQAILQQTLPVTELVLVDNGNPSDIEARLDALAAADPRLRIQRGQGNVGFAAACNLGASLCAAPRLLFLNPDCLLPEDGHARLAEEFAALPPRSLLSPLLVNEDFTEQRGSRRAVLTPWRAAVEWLGLYRLAPAHPYFLRFNRTHEPLPLGTHKVDVTSGAAMLMQRSLFAELGGFDERYFLHVEDVDLCVTLLKRGGSAYVAPAVRVIHQASSSDVSHIRVEWHKAVGFCRYFRKQFKAVYPVGFVPLVNLLVWLRFGIRLPLMLLRRRAGLGHRASGKPAGRDAQPNTGD